MKTNCPKCGTEIDVLTDGGCIGVIHCQKCGVCVMIEFDLDKVEVKNEQSIDSK